MSETIPLMPKATAVWLVDNTGLTFEQVADFCGLHPLEVQGIADGEVAIGIMGQDPVASGQVTQDNIVACEADSSKRLKLLKADYPELKPKRKQTRYTPVARRRDKPDSIAWLVKNYPEMKDSQIVKLVGTTKKTIDAIRSRSHWNIQNIKPRDPVLAGVCTQLELDKAIGKARINAKVEQVAAPDVHAVAPVSDTPDNTEHDQASSDA